MSVYCDNCRAPMSCRSSEGLQYNGIDIPAHIHVWRCGLCPEYALSTEDSERIRLAQDTPFRPDWASPPGYTLLCLLEEKNILAEMLAEQLHLSISGMDKLLSGQLPITEDLAQGLARVLGGSVAFWLKRESNYRAAVERISCRK